MNALFLAFGTEQWMLFQWILPIVGFVFALWAQSRVTSTFQRFARVTTRSGLSGAEVAQLLLRARGLEDVRVERTEGFLRDHYDPRIKTLRLSADVHDGRSVAAFGVAAHETGHALQHADAYAWLGFRNAIAPVVSFSSKLAGFLFPFGLLFIWGSQFVLPFLYAWAIAVVVIVLFSIVTLPVEIDASARALRLLGNTGVLVGDEVTGARAVLEAAAWTYVAGAAAAIIELLRILSYISMARGRDRRS